MTTIPTEADWETAPSLIDGASRLELTPRDCHLDYWFSAVAQGTLAGLVHGHGASTRMPSYMLKPGPLRDAIMNEFAFRSIAEEKATRAISYIVVNAPEDVLRDEHLEQRGFFVPVEHPGWGEVRRPGVPFRFSAFPPARLAGPPGLGEHSDEILRNAGYDEAAIKKLRASGAVA